MDFKSKCVIKKLQNDLRELDRQKNTVLTGVQKDIYMLKEEIAERANAKLSLSLSDTVDEFTLVRSLTELSLRLEGVEEAFKISESSAVASAKSLRAELESLNINSLPSDENGVQGGGGEVNLTSQTIASFLQDTIPEEPAEDLNPGPSQDGGDEAVAEPPHTNDDLELQIILDMVDKILKKYSKRIEEIKISASDVWTDGSLAFAWRRLEKVKKKMRTRVSNNKTLHYNDYMYGGTKGSRFGSRWDDRPQGSFGSSRHNSTRQNSTIRRGHLTFKRPPPSRDVVFLRRCKKLQEECNISVQRKVDEFKI